MSAQRRAYPCHDCPFRQSVNPDALERGDPVEMLCHESGSLDGTGPDLVCRGWEDSHEEE